MVVDSPPGRTIAVDAGQIRRVAHLDGVRAEPRARADVLPNVALQGQHADSVARGIVARPADAALTSPGRRA